MVADVAVVVVGAEEGGAGQAASGAAEGREVEGSAAVAGAEAGVSVEEEGSEAAGVADSEVGEAEASVGGGEEDEEAWNTEASTSACKLLVGSQRDKSCNHHRQLVITLAVVWASPMRGPLSQTSFLYSLSQTVSSSVLLLAGGYGCAAVRVLQLLEGILQLVDVLLECRVHWQPPTDGSLQLQPEHGQQHTGRSMSGPNPSKRSSHTSMRASPPSQQCAACAGPRASRPRLVLQMSLRPSCPSCRRSCRSSWASR